MIAKVMRNGLIMAVTLYEVLVVSLLTNELLAASFRATDRVLMLLGLLFLPVLLILIVRTMGDSKLINLKLPGNLEIMVQDLEKKVVATTEKADQLEKHMEGKLSTAERTLYPVIGGQDAFSDERLRQRRLIIGSKDFEANIVVAEIVAQHLESYGIQCERRIPNGGTLTNYACLSYGWIDCFVDYTGTGCLFYNVSFRNRKPEEVLGDLNRISSERFHYEWLQPLGSKTNYCLVMRDDIAEKKGINRLSQLEYQDRGQLRFCSNFEFMSRLDGLPGLKAFYNVRFAEEIVGSYSDRYAFLLNGKADISVGHSTDPAIREHQLRIIEDDRQFFPDYFEVPLVRTEALQRIPELKPALLDLVTKKIGSDDIVALVQDYNENQQSLAGQVQALLARKAKAQTGAASIEAISDTALEPAEP